MDAGQVFQIEMLKAGIKNIKELADKSGLTYDVTRHILIDKPSARFEDVKSVAKALNIEVIFKLIAGPFGFYTNISLA